jgi:hypothetical protein
MPSPTQLRKLTTATSPLPQLPNSTTDKVPNRAPHRHVHSWPEPLRAPPATRRTARPQHTAAGRKSLPERRSPARPDLGRPRPLSQSPRSQHHRPASSTSSLQPRRPLCRLKLTEARHRSELPSPSEASTEVEKKQTLSVFWIPGYPGPHATGLCHRPIFSPGENNDLSYREDPHEEAPREENDNING